MFLRNYCSDESKWQLVRENRTEEVLQRRITCFHSRQMRFLVVDSG